MIHRLRVEQDGKYNTIHRIYLDDKKIEGVCSFNFEIQPGQAPKVNMEVLGGASFDIVADVDITTSHSLYDSYKLIKSELLRRGDLYDSTLKSIESTLKEFGNNKKYDSKKLSKAILNRVIGVE